MRRAGLSASAELLVRIHNEFLSTFLPNEITLHFDIFRFYNHSIVLL